MRLCAMPILTIAITTKNDTYASYVLANMAAGAWHVEPELGVRFPTSCALESGRVEVALDTTADNKHATPPDNERVEGVFHMQAGRFGPADAEARVVNGHVYIGRWDRLGMQFDEAFQHMQDRHDRAVVAVMRSYVEADRGVYESVCRRVTDPVKRAVWKKKCDEGVAEASAPRACACKRGMHVLE